MTPDIEPEGVISFVDKDKKSPKHSESQPARSPEMEELYRRLEPEMRRPKPSADAIAAALEAAQRLAAESDAEQSADDVAQDFTADSAVEVCRSCGYRNRGGNRFCGMCGLAVSGDSKPQAAFSRGDEHMPASLLPLPPNPYLDPQPEARPPAGRTSAQETHYYHHHYHHHYFPGGAEGMAPRPAAEPVRDPDRMRPTAALRGDMSRAEAAVRRITHEWVLACNTKHLDDLLDLYVADPLVLRSNYPPIRGAASVREFFFGALDAGLGEVELEPLRVEVVGELSYEAGRCKALIPGATGKRREERGKYLWVCFRQSNGEWRLAADCWSSDLSLTLLESDAPPSTGVKTSQQRKP